MASRRKKIWFGLLIIAAVLAISAYFYVPKMFADEVYPLKYTSFIVKYAQKYNVDAALIAAVILQESRFNPEARSGAGAEGLMQFMPGTAATMAKETGHWPDYDIYDPETSVEFGAAHLRDLLIKYDGDVAQALAGYNAGTGTVDSWLRLNIFEKIINSGSTSETVNYVQKVKNYQKVYTTMYADELQLPIDVTAQLRETSPAQEEAKVRGFVWIQIFSNIFHF